MLRPYKVCVLPDPKIKTFDRLPVFSIIESSLKDKSMERPVTKKRTITVN